MDGGAGGGATQLLNFGATENVSRRYHFNTAATITATTITRPTKTRPPTVSLANISVPASPTFSITTNSLLSIFPS